ncbi:nucleotidyltransferase family protein [Amycolatopsis benzoatilytica]|uniref:nucleotidyltransferase family protein n=1 Tax=Amycolatopsis benzoatilytica TaxID=346045 RepID=UPI00037097AD|nr:nucleotidyltransferase family protein [Amycolatopsis benzoatilytica]
MNYGRLPIAEQLDVFRATVLRNGLVPEILARAAEFDLPGWYLTAGCLCQTVWNVLTGRPPAEGIKDYDLFYFDDSDLSWEAENSVIEAGAKLFGDLPAAVEIRNEARVHLWYEERFGVPCAPYESTEAAIDSFPSSTPCLGIRQTRDGAWRVYAPHGFGDMFNLVVRPNPVHAPQSSYQAKSRRWQAQWPQLTVLPWLPRGNPD